MHQNEAKLKQKKKKQKLIFFFFNLLKTWVLVFTLSKKKNSGSDRVLSFAFKSNAILLCLDGT